MRTIQIIFICCITIISVPTALSAQELLASININHSKIQGTNTNVFSDLETNITEFMNDRKWTGQQYNENERIRCTFNITLNTYDETRGSFNGSLLLQVIRPVFNSSYNTVEYSVKDEDFDFTYREFDKLEFRVDQINNDLTALLGYYAYLIIGIDNDTMSPEGGTEFLKTALDIANSAQSLSGKGWKTTGSDNNRYALISDMLDGSMSPFRKLQYVYHREGLDVMAQNAETGRAKITEAIELLNQAHKNKTLSKLPQLFTEYKRDELVNIYTGQGTSQEKEKIYNTLSSINASYNTYWRKLSK
jgi:hypothetical protein